MKLAEKVISLTLAVLMVLTGVPVRASNVSADKIQTAVREQVAQQTAQAQGINPYGPTFPTLKEQIDQMTAAVRKMKEKSPSVIEKFKKVADKISKLSDKDKEALKKELQTWKNDTDQYVAKNPAALAKYAKGDAEQQALALQTVAYDKMKQMQVQATTYHNFQTGWEKAHDISILVLFISFFIFVYTAGVDMFSVMGTAALEDYFDICLGVMGAAGIAIIITGIGILCTSAVTRYFSAEAGHMDCGTLQHKHPCRPINPEKAKAEFLDNPFKAVEFFATHDPGEAAVLYLADEEGANMLRNTVNILAYAPIYDVEDPVSQKYIQKMAYVNTMYWKKLSKQDKIKYLFELSMQVLVDPDVRTRQ